MTEASSQLYPVVNSHNDLRPDAESANDATEKCPVCFMLFPQTMKKQEREQHVNEHYADDE